MQQLSHGEPIFEGKSEEMVVEEVLKLKEVDTDAERITIISFTTMLSGTT